MLSICLSIKDIMEIIHQFKIKANKKAIIEAVSTQKGIAGWWCKNCQIGENIGSKSFLEFDKQGTIVNMTFETIELVPAQKVVWQCINNTNENWLNTFIKTEVIGDQVQFTHGGFREKLESDPGFEVVKETWKHFVSSLIAYCETGKGFPW